MTEDLGRIGQLKTAIDSLYVIRRAVHILESETGLDFFKEPEKTLNKARYILYNLKKQ